MAIPGGNAGTLQTLHLMRRMVNKAKKDWPIRELAMRIVQNLPEKNWTREVQAIHAWIRKNIRYIKDINGVETLHTPQKILELRQGDCDDQSILIATMLESIGHRARLHAIGFQPNKFAHVYVDTKIGTKWVAVETTEPWPVGKSPANAVSHMIVNIAG